MLHYEIGIRKDDGLDSVLCQIWPRTSNLTLSPYLGRRNLFREESIPRMMQSLAGAIFGDVCGKNKNKTYTIRSYTSMND